VDHEDGNFVILGMVEHTGVEVVDLAVVESGVRHFDDRATGKFSRVQDLFPQMLRM
jgi:hypothetical protein